MVTRAKFKVTAKTVREGGNEITLQPVTSGSEENKSFFRWTPYGSITIGTINDDVFNNFEVGKDYYVDFTAAAEPVKIDGFIK